MKIGFRLFFVSVALSCCSPSPQKSYWQNPKSINPEAIAYQVKGAELYRKRYNYSSQDSITKLYISYLDTALAIDSKYELALSERAQSYLILNQKDKAISDYQTLIGLNDANPYPKIMLASIYMKDGDSVRGTELFNQSFETLSQEIELYPDSINLYIACISILQKINRKEDAETLLQKLPKNKNRAYIKSILENL